jgi:SAM-dependent methyltransferase
VDLDPRIRDNPNLRLAVLGDLLRLPFRDRSFDLILARYVFEHFPWPEKALRELRRVLKSGGRLIFHTPNRFHYYALAARITPQRFHEWFREKRGGTRADTHETFYRANDRFALRRLAGRTGFRVMSLELFEPKPSYLFFHPLAYRAGIGYERLVRRFDVLKDLRANMIGVLEAI